MHQDQSCTINQNIIEIANMAKYHQNHKKLQCFNKSKMCDI